jgi:TPR repeat protein
MQQDELFMQAHGLLAKGDYGKSFLAFQKLVLDHYVPAIHFLAWMYEQGLGTEPNPEKAFHYWFIAANAGNCVSQHALGMCFQNGEGTQKDLVQAYYWLHSAVQCALQNPEQECGAYLDLKELKDRLTVQQINEAGRLLKF